MTTFNQLINAWKLDETMGNLNNYIAEIDLPIYERFEKQFSTINLTQPPQPFWGNIKNPSIIVLFNNPNIQGTLKKKYIQSLLDNIKGIQPFDYLDDTDEENEDYKYWRRRFNNIKEVMTESGISNFNKYIGEFEFHGYNSSTFRKFNIKETYDGYLPTQIYMFEHIKNIIKVHKPLIILARGKTNWLEALNLDENNEDVIIVRSPQSAYLSIRNGDKGNIEAHQFDRIIKRIKETYTNTKTRESI